MRKVIFRPSAKEAMEATLAERDNELVEAGRKLEVLENELMNLRARLQTEVVT